MVQDGENLRSWLSSRGGSLKMRVRDGVSEVIASAHNLATTVVVKDLADTAEVHRGETEAIEEAAAYLRCVSAAISRPFHTES